MTDRALVAGELARMQRRTAKNGVSYLALNVALQGGKEVRLYCFNSRVIEETEALQAGEKVAFAGRLWTPNGAREPSLVADGVLHAYSKPRRSAAMDAVGSDPELPLLIPLQPPADKKRAS